MRVLYVTSEWPTRDHFWAAPFIVRQVNALRGAGIDVDVFAFRGKRRLANYVQIYRDVQKRLQYEEYDVIHAQFGHSGLLVSLPKRLPLVVTFQGSELLGIYTSRGKYHPISYPLRAAMQWVAFAADEVVLVAEHMRRFLLRKDAHIIPGGIDLELFKPIAQDQARQQLGLDASQPLVAFVGSPSNAVKRYPLALAAMAQLPPELGAKLVTVNGVSPDLLPLYFNAADALLVTSKHEGSPNVVKEAMACNLPIVTVNVGDVEERLSNVSECSIVPSDDPAEIATRLTTVLCHRKRTNGWEIAQQLDSYVLAKRQIEVYELAMSKSHRKPGRQ